MVNNSSQVYLFFTFTFVGIIIGILFDIFRILRKTFKTSDFMTYIQDIIFWLLSGILLIYSIFVFNNGELRAYIFFGLFIGIIIYILTISKYFIKLNVLILTLIKNIFEFIIRIILYPLKIILNFIKSILAKPLGIIYSYIKKIISKMAYIIHKFTISKKKIQKTEGF